MSQENYIAAEFGKSAFHCPICNVFAEQNWHDVFRSTDISDIFQSTDISHTLIRGVQSSTCFHCKEFCIWINKKLIYPPETTAPLAHNDMPESVLEYYNEARQISAISPRATAALLRLAIKKLCEYLGEDESNLNKSIGNLSKKGLPQNVINSLDTVRIIGNEGGAHEGQIDLTGKDNEQIVNRLFKLINFIVSKTITEPKEIQDMYSSIPENKKQSIEHRDKG